MNIPTLKEIQAQKNKPPETSTLANEATKKHIEPYKLTSHYPIEQLKKLKQPKSITFANGKKLAVQEMTQKIISEAAKSKEAKTQQQQQTICLLSGKTLTQAELTLKIIASSKTYHNDSKLLTQPKVMLKTSLTKQRSINEMLKQQQKKRTKATITKSPEQQSQSSIPEPLQNTEGCLAVTDTGPNTSAVTMVNQTPLPSSETSMTANPATEDTQEAHPINAPVIPQSKRSPEPTQQTEERYVGLTQTKHTKLTQENEKSINTHQVEPLEDNSTPSKSTQAGLTEADTTLKEPAEDNLMATNSKQANITESNTTPEESEQSKQQNKKTKNKHKKELHHKDHQHKHHHHKEKHKKKHHSEKADKEKAEKENTQPKKHHSEKAEKEKAEKEKAKKENTQLKSTADTEHKKTEKRQHNTESQNQENEPSLKRKSNMENGQVHKKSKPSEDNILQQQPQLQMQPEIQEVQIQELQIQQQIPLPQQLEIQQQMPLPQIINITPHDKDIAKQALQLIDTATKQTFYRKIDQPQHIKDVVEVIKERKPNGILQCSNCGYEHRTKWNVERHIMLSHCKVMLYKCRYENCPYRATECSKVLRHHFYNHTMPLFQ